MVICDNCNKRMLRWNTSCNIKLAIEYAHNNHATSFAIIATENLELIFFKNFFIIKEKKNQYF